MGKLIYAITTSLDGYVAESNGNFDWAEPSEEVHFAFNEIVRNVGTSLFGRKMYEVMKVWDDIPADGDSEAMNDYVKIWNETSKIIYSTSLVEVTTANTILERSFNAGAVKKQVAESDRDFAIGGPHLAAQAIKAGIVDEYHQIIAPVIIGNGNHWLPKDINIELELIDVRKFENGFVHLHYRRAVQAKP